MKEIFGEYLKKLRIDRRMTMHQIEKESGVSNAYISQIERGKRSPPTIKILAKLAKAYGVPLSALNQKAEEQFRFNKISNIENIISAPNTEFIRRGYESLSENKKRLLKDFLLYLQSGR